MATVNLGAIKFNWKGAYNNSTAYAVDDVVSSGGNSYVCIQAHTNQPVGNATAYWNIMSSAGTNGSNGSNGTDLTSTLTTRGDIVYKGASALTRLPKGTAGYYLKQGANDPEWSAVSAGAYSVHRIDRYYDNTVVNHGGNTAYLDIANGNTVNFTPTNTNDRVFISHTCATHFSGSDTGLDIYMNMGTSASLGSSDTKLNYDGNHSNYTGSGDQYRVITKTFILECAGLTVGTTYYLEQAGSVHNGNTAGFNRSSTGYSGSYRAHQVNLIHYKINS